MRININDESNDIFFQIPKSLFEMEKYKNLSDGAKIAYGFLKNRASLSKKNGWYNENGDIFIQYSRMSLANNLNKTPKTASKYFEQLRNVNLIEEDRLGCNKCNRIYVLMPECDNKYIYTKESDKSTENVLKNNKVTSKSDIITHQDITFLPTNKTDSNKIKLSKNYFLKHSFKQKQTNNRKNEEKIPTLKEVETEFGHELYIKVVAKFADKCKCIKGSRGYRKYIYTILKDISNNKESENIKESIDIYKNQNCINNKINANMYKNRFHNFEQRTDNYTAEQLENIILENQENGVENNVTNVELRQRADAYIKELITDKIGDKALKNYSYEAICEIREEIKDLIISKNERDIKSIDWIERIAKINREFLQDDDLEEEFIYDFDLASIIEMDKRC